MHRTVESSETSLHAVLRVVRASLTRRVLVGAGAVVLASASLVLLALVAWDHSASGGAPIRLLSLAGIAWIIATIAVLCVCLSKLAARRLSTPHVARAIEQSHGIPHNLVLNAVLVEGNRRLAYVAGTAERQAAFAIENLPHAATVRGGSQAWPWAAAGAAALIWLAYATLAPKAVLPTLGRIFGMSIAAPTATQIELLRPTADERIYSGQAVTIEVRVRGRTAETGTFQLRDSAGGAERVTASYSLKRVAERSATDVRSLTLAAHEVTQTVAFRIAIGDATLDGVLTVRPVPAITSIAVELTPPAYLNAQPTVATSSPVHAWSGTRARVVAGASTTMHAPVLVMAGATETRTRLTPETTDASRAVAEVLLRESGEFWVEFNDDAGRSARSTPMRVVVRSDAPPEIALAAPTSDEIKAGPVSVDAVPRIAAIVRDDVAIEEIVVVVERDGATLRQRLVDADGVRGKTTIEAGVPTDSFDVTPGKTVRVWFEARDNRRLEDSVVAGQTSSSAAITLTRDKLSARKRTQRDERELTKARESKEAGRAELVQSSAEGDEPGEGGDGEAGAAQEGQTVRRAADGEDGAVLRVDEEMNGGDKKSPSDSDKAKPSDAPASEGDGKPDDDDAKEMSDAEKAFDEELQRFSEKHGDDAGEAGRRMGGASEQDEANPPDQPQAPRESPPGMPPQEKDPNAPTSRPAQPPTSQQAGNANPTDEPKRDPSPTEGDQGDDAKDEAKDGDKQDSDQGDNGAQPKPERGDDSPQPDPQGDQPQPGHDAKGGKQGDQKQDSPGDKKSDKSGDRPPPAPPKPAEPPQPQDAPPNAPSPDGATSQPADKPSEPQTAGDEPAADNLDVPSAGRDERVMQELEEPKVEPPPADQSAERPPPAAAADERSGEIVDALRLLERSEGVTERELLDLGWSAEKASAFVRDFERLREAALRAGVLGDLKRWKSRARLGEAKLVGGVGEGTNRVVDATDLLTDSMHQFATPPEQEISPSLRAVLNAYYQSLARKRATSRPAE